FVPVEYGPPVELPDDAYPFVMNTGRQLYHWHTGTMTRRATGLDQREPTAIMEINPADAAALGIEEGDLARVTSRRNSLVISCRISDRVARGRRRERPPPGIGRAGRRRAPRRDRAGCDRRAGRRRRPGAGRGARRTSAP